MRSSILWFFLLAVAASVFAGEAPPKRPLLLANYYLRILAEWKGVPFTVPPLPVLE